MSSKTCQEFITAADNTPQTQLEFMKLPPSPSFFPLRLSLFSFDCQLTFFCFFILEKNDVHHSLYYSTQTSVLRLGGGLEPSVLLHFPAQQHHSIYCLKMKYFARFPTLLPKEIPSTRL